MNPKIETPRTDALAASGNAHFLSLNFARQLETELNAVTKERERARNDYAYLLVGVEELNKERDQLRQSVEELLQILRDCDVTFANGAHRDNPIRRLIAMQLSTKPQGGDEPRALQPIESKTAPSVEQPLETSTHNSVVASNATPESSDPTGTRQLCTLNVDSPCYPPTDEERKQCGCENCLKELNKARGLDPEPPLTGLLTTMTESTPTSLDPEPASPEFETEQDAAAEIRFVELAAKEAVESATRERETHAPMAYETFVLLKRALEKELTEKANLQTALDNARAQERVMRETAEGHAKTIRDIAESVLGDPDLANRGDVAERVVSEYGKSCARWTHWQTETVRAKEQRDAHAAEVTKLRAELETLNKNYASDWAKVDAELERAGIVMHGDPLTGHRAMEEGVSELAAQRDSALADVARLREALQKARSLVVRHHDVSVTQSLGCFCPVCSPDGKDEPFNAVFNSLLFSAPTSDRLRELEAASKLLSEFEKFIWSNGHNHIIIAPYRIGKTDEKRVAIFAHDDAPLDNELGDGVTFAEAFQSARKESKP